MSTEKLKSINDDIAERIEISRQAVESGSSDMKFVNKYLKEDFCVKLVRKGKKVEVEYI